MPGIMQLRQNFQGGGADLGASATGMGSGRDSPPGPGDTGGEGGYNTKDTSQFDRGDGIQRNTGLEKQRIKNIEKINTRNDAIKEILLTSLLPGPLKIGYGMYKNYPALVSAINRYTDLNMPTYKPKSITSLLTPTGTIKKEEEEKIFGDNDPIIPTGILTQQPQMLANAPIIDVPREDIYPFFNAADFDIDPQYIEYGIGNLYG